MLTEYLRIFNLKKGFTIDELNKSHKSLLKEYKIKDLDDELKEILLEEEEKINKYYKYLVNEYNNRDRKIKTNHENSMSSSIGKIPIKKEKKKNKRRENNKKENIELIIYSLIIILILGLIGYFISHDISKNNINNIIESTNCDVMINENNEFVIIGSDRLINNVDDLISCFKKNSITLISINGEMVDYPILYKLMNDSLIYSKIDNVNEDEFSDSEISELEILHAEIKISTLKESKKLSDIIYRVINYKKLKSNQGLDGIGAKWRIDSELILLLKNKKDFNNFKRLSKSIDKYYKLNDFLKKNLPKSAYTSIIRINNKLINLQKIKEDFLKNDTLTIFEEKQIKECKNIGMEYNYIKKYYSLVNIFSDTARLELNFYKNKSKQIIKEFKKQQANLNSCMCVDCIIKLGSNDHIKIDSLIYSYKWNNYLSEYSNDSNNENTNLKEINLIENSSSLNNSVNKGICRTIRGSYFWKIKLNNLEKAKNISNKKLKIEGLIKEIKKRVEKFRSCRCKKCNHELNNSFLQAIINEFFNEKKQYNKIEEDEIIEIEEDDEEFFMTVENMPEFPGGDLGVMKFIQKNIRYPAIAKEYNITGKVYVSFIVDKQGSVTNVKIVRGVDKNLDAEALRVVSLLPKYKPGKQRGKAVRVMFTIPINFTLN